MIISGSVTSSVSPMSIPMWWVFVHSLIFSGCIWSCLSQPPHLLAKEGVNGAEAVGASGVEGEVLGGRGPLYDVAQSLFLLWAVLGGEPTVSMGRGL